MNTDFPEYYGVLRIGDTVHIEARGIVQEMPPTGTPARLGLTEGR
jgi:hypothetical protein